MAILTNKSDVIANFVRYYGRQPQASDMATIDYLTTKPPAEVESKLAATSPITGGLLWSAYQAKQTATKPATQPVQTTTPVQQFSSSSSTVATPQLTPINPSNPTTPVIAPTQATQTINPTTTTVSTPAPTNSTTRTNLQDVINTFVRYYGRQPNADDMKNLQYLTSKSPTEVEASLKSTAPVTSGAVKPTETIGATDPMAGIYEEIDKLNYSPEQKSILKQLAKGSYTSGQKIMTTADVTKAIETAALNAESDLNPYFQEMTAKDIQDARDKFADIRNASARYTQQEAKTYKEKLDTTKADLRKRGITFSGISRQTLGKQGANDWAGVEGEVPQQRRYDIEDQGAKFAEAARDTGKYYEARLGSAGLKEQIDNGQINVNNLNVPYDLAGGNIDYQPGRQTTMYTPGKVDSPLVGQYTRYGSNELAKKKALEESKWARLKTYSPNL